MFWWGFISGAVVAMLYISLYSIFYVSSKCSREEELREQEFQ